MIASSDTRQTLLRGGDDRGAHSLPILRDWQTWWREWGPRVAQDVGRHGWILFLLDSSERILEMQMTLSRVIRGKPEWDTSGWSEREWGSVAEMTAEGMAWFEKNSPRVDDVPEWAAFILTAQRGLFQTAWRLGRELQTLREQGYTTVVLEERQDGIHCVKGGDRFLTEVEA